MHCHWRDCQVWLQNHALLTSCQLVFAIRPLVYIRSRCPIFCFVSNSFLEPFEQRNKILNGRSSNRSVLDWNNALSLARVQCHILSYFQVCYWTGEKSKWLWRDKVLTVWNENKTYVCLHRLFTLEGKGLVLVVHSFHVVNSTRPSEWINGQQSFKVLSFEKGICRLKSWN